MAAAPDRDIMNANTDKKFDVITKLLTALAIVGAINWGLIGFFNFNLVDAILGGGRVEETSSASRVVYALVGLAGLVAAFLLPKLHKVDVGHRRVAHQP